MSEAALIQKVPVESLMPHPENARVGDVAAIARSLERFGQVKPIIVQRSTGYVVAGNHTLKAAVKLGWSHVDVRILDLDDSTARAYLVTDNMTSDKARYDESKRAKLYGALLGDPFFEKEGIRDAYESIMEELNENGNMPKRRVPEQHDEIELGEGEETETETETEGTRTVSLSLPVSQLRDFGTKINDLQELWGLHTLPDIVLRAVNEAHDRWKAGVGRSGSEQALPQELIRNDF